MLEVVAFLNLYNVVTLSLLKKIVLVVRYIFRLRKRVVLKNCFREGRSWEWGIRPVFELGF